MAECVALPSCFKLHTSPANTVKAKRFPSRNLYFGTVTRKFPRGQCKVIPLSKWKMYEVQGFGIPNLSASRVIRDSCWRCNISGSSVNLDFAEVLDWIPAADQILLTASIFLTYLAGVIPIEKSNLTSSKTLSGSLVPEISIGSGSVSKNDDKVHSEYAWDIVNKKLMDSIKAMEYISDLENRDPEFEQVRVKTPLSLYAVAEGPRLRLLWASFRFLKDKVTGISEYTETVSKDEWLTVLYRIIQTSHQPVCMSWLEGEFCHETGKSDKKLIFLMSEKLKGDDTLSENIRKSGKEDLYAELLFFLKFGYLREEFSYNNRLFTVHGVSILEDLVVTVADWIASNYLELISVDGNLSNEINGLGLDFCTLSTRALQKLRNEVALNQWLHQNIQTVISMFEDRFDLCTLHSRSIEEPSGNKRESYAWWKNLSLKESGTLSSSLQYVVIRQFSMPVKRTKELRALNGWRYYFSLFLELSDITMPFIQSVCGKVSSAVSFFLVSLIGRSLGLIYTGIRQSLRWK